MLNKRIYSFWKRIGFLYNWTKDKKELDDALKVLYKGTMNVINVRRKILQDKINDGTYGSKSDNDDLGGKQRRPFLDSLLIAQSETGLLTDLNIREEVDTFIFGVLLLSL